LSSISETLIHHRLARARETYAEALLMKEGKRWHGCVNRLYYACFYAATALLLSKNLPPSKHSGTRSLFNKHFVKSGLVAPELGELYNTLFDLRQEGDYDDFVQLNSEDIEPWIPLTHQLLQAAEDLLTKH
jgi:uncharacterized protein (UPF0332 family)